jgi:hypothetical protein
VTKQNVLKKGCYGVIREEQHANVERDKSENINFIKFLNS